MIRRFLDISTGHLDGASRDALNEASRDTLLSMKDSMPPGVTIDGARGEAAAQSLIVYPACYGWFCYAHDDFPLLAEAGVPEVLIDIFRHARSQSCDYVMFDADAEEVSTLPLFPWP